MRLASYNLQNLFDRPKVMNSEAWINDPGASGSGADRQKSAREILTAYSATARLLSKPTYSPSDKIKIADGLIAMGLEDSDNARFVRLRVNKPRLLKRPNSGGIEIVANGRGDWGGWLELEPEEVNEVATQNTARVIHQVNADILAVVEVEDRIPLLRFNDQVLPEVNCPQYDHVMVINGNDERGIDVGVMTRGYPIARMRSHVDDRDEAERRIFSRDCPCYSFQTVSGPLWVLVNHFKSKGFGNFAESTRRRRAQAERVREIYNDLIAEGVGMVAVVGDLNDTPGSDALQPLFEATDLKDISEHQNYEMKDDKIGSYGNCAASDHIDFILLSPALFQRVQYASVDRSGIWGGKNGDMFDRLDTINAPAEAASDHAAIYVDLDI